MYCYFICTVYGGNELRSSYLIIVLDVDGHANICPPDQTYHATYYTRCLTILLLIFLIINF